MKRILVFLGLVFGSLMTTRPQIQNDGEKAWSTDLDRYLTETMRLHEIPGFAIAVIKDGELEYERYFGVREITKQESVDSCTIFRVYSTTKLITTTAVFQLIGKEKIALSDALNDFYDQLPKEWGQVQIENLLTHSSGLPDLIKFDATLTDQQLFQELFAEEMDFSPGSRFWYNQTNYWLLGEIVEKVGGTTFEAYVLKNQFGEEKDDVFFSSNSLEKRADRSFKYGYDHEKGSYTKTTNNDGTRGHPGNGLNITLSAFVKWNKRLDSNILLDQKTKEVMFSPFKFENNKDKFLLGWGDYSHGDIVSYGFTGGGVSAFRKFPEHGLTIVFLSNGYKFYPVHNYVVEQVAAIVTPEVTNRSMLVQDGMLTMFLTESIEKAKRYYFEAVVKDPNINFEGTLNSIGYILMNQNRLADALEVFRLNVAEHPNSWNVYDSLGEGYYKTGQLGLAKVNYQRSIAINSQNNNGKAMLDRIAEDMKSQ
ncbi:MAG: serine hydrolase [Bacteroidota bacterium]